MHTAKKEARLLLIYRCNEDLYAVIVFRGPFRLEYANTGTRDVIEEVARSSIFDEIRYVWPPSFSRKLGLSPLPNLESYFGSCLLCVDNLAKNICSIADNLIVSENSLLFKDQRESNKRSQ